MNRHINNKTNVNKTITILNNLNKTLKMQHGWECAEDNTEEVFLEMKGTDYGMVLNKNSNTYYPYKLVHSGGTYWEPNFVDIVDIKVNNKIGTLSITEAWNTVLQDCVKDISELADMFSVEEYLTDENDSNT